MAQSRRAIYVRGFDFRVRAFPHDPTDWTPPKERYAEYQLVFRNRARNLRQIVDNVGSWYYASRITGKSIQLLKQCAGDNPCRSIGDTLAKELEITLRLTPGALSQSPK